jgi:hypothetical protein
MFNDTGFVQQWTTPSEDYVLGAGESVPFEYGLPGLQDKDPASVTLTFTPSESE